MHYQERNSSRRTGSLCALYVFSYGHISKGHLTALSWLSHFRVLKNLTFKTRLNAKLFLWKWVLLHENRPYSRYLPSFHAFNWWDERKVTWFLTYLIRVLQYSFLNFALPSPLASLFRVVYAFHITWSGLVFQASPNLSSRRNYDQEGLGRRPYKNLENFCLMINNLRLIIINSKRNNSYFKAGGGGGRERKNIGCRGGSPKNSFKFCSDGICLWVMQRVHQKPARMPKACVSNVEKVRISHGSIPPDPRYRLLSVAHSFVQRT